MDAIIDALGPNGWLELRNVSSDKDLMEISKSIGQILPHPNGRIIDLIQPKSGENTIVGTFSNRFGFERFPLHTDTAFWTTPARYVLLGSAHQSACPTMLMSAKAIWNILGKDAVNCAQRAVFKVKTINHRFFASLLFKEDNAVGIKYDPTCMFPANAFALSFQKHIAEVEECLPKDEFVWNGSNALLIDNWNVLHGRGPAVENEKRLLKRIYLK